MLERLVWKRTGLISMGSAEALMDNATTIHTHHPLHREVRAIAGRCVITREVRMPLKGREVLYLTGVAVFDSTCCGVGGCGYAWVPGFIVHWKHRKNADGLLVSEVAPIRDDDLKKEVKQMIERREIVSQVNFG